MRGLARIAGGTLGVLFAACSRHPPTGNAQRVPAASASAELPTASGVPGSGTATDAPPPWAHWLEASTHGVLWVRGATLGALDFDTGRTAFVVTEPRGEAIRCAAWSEDGELLAALSASGSASLWSRAGTRIATVVGDGHVKTCSADDFQFATKVPAVAVIADGAPARLIGKGIATVLPRPVEPGASWARFGPDGRRLFTRATSNRIRVIDAQDGKVVGELVVQTPIEFSSDGAYLSAVTAEDTTALVDSQTLKVLESLEGTHATFARNMILVEQGMGDDSTVAAYALTPFAQRWQRRGISIFEERGFSERPGQDHGPWLVGGTGHGYAVFDANTGSTLATWHGSEYGCGYFWGWERGTLVFLEGDRITLWKAGAGAQTHQVPDCVSHQPPVFSTDRSRFIALDAVWSVAARRPILRPRLPHRSKLERFSHDERLILGVLGSASESDLSTFAAAWNAADGRLAWNHALAQYSGRPTARLQWSTVEEESRVIGFLNETNGTTTWLGNVAASDGKVVPIAFDDKCWDGPDKLPERELPRGMPTLRCPDLLSNLYATVGAQTHAVVGSAQ